MISVMMEICDTELDTILSSSLSVGEVRVSLPDMDREVKGHYEVVIQAKDMAGQLGGLAGTTTVNITLSDVNDNPPHFTQSEYILPSYSLRVSTFVLKMSEN